jgi:ABC-type Mn2+/Zn2+ transport system permease subunit
MIADFLASWALFADAWLASWLIAVLLALLGVAVLARGQVFLGAAMSQSATAGIALVLGLWGPVHGAWILHLDAIVAMAAALAAAIAVGLGRGHREAVTGWIVLTAGAVAMLAVARSPHGAETVNRLLASSLVGATGGDVVVFALMLAAVVAVVCWRGGVLRALFIDPGFAAAVGVRVGRWELALAIALGLAIGWSLHVAGTLYAFGCLILPALAARQVCREVGTMALVAPAIALVLAVAGSVIANAADLPPAQVTVALLGGAVAAGWLWRRLPLAG